MDTSLVSHIFLLSDECQNYAENIMLVNLLSKIWYQKFWHTFGTHLICRRIQPIWGEGDQNCWYILCIYHNTQWVKNNFKKSHNTSYISLFSNIWLIVYLAHEELHVGIGNEPNIRKKCQPCKYLVCTVFKSWSMKFVNNFCYVIYI